jgi:hypothetical protein
MTVPRRSMFLINRPFWRAGCKREGQMRAGYKLISALFAIALLGAPATAQQTAKSGKYVGRFGAQVTGQPYELEKGHVFFLGTGRGVFFNDVSGGFIDKTEGVCAFSNDIVNGVSTGSHGYCTMTDKDGDKAFLGFEGKGSTPESASGTFRWTGGTGKFSGLQGNNTWRLTTIGNTTASWVVWEGDWRVP